MYEGVLSKMTSQMYTNEISNKCLYTSIVVHSSMHTIIVHYYCTLQYAHYYCTLQYAKKKKNNNNNVSQVVLTTKFICALRWGVEVLVFGC